MADVEPVAARLPVFGIPPFIRHAPVSAPFGVAHAGRPIKQASRLRSQLCIHGQSNNTTNFRAACFLATSDSQIICPCLDSLLVGEMGVVRDDLAVVDQCSRRDDGIGEFQAAINPHGNRLLDQRVI